MITVVVPTLNAESSLAATLTSLVPGAVDGIVRQVIIVDGGSSDRTLRIAEDSGADIVRIDSEARIDTARTLQPFHHDEGLPDNSVLYGNLNAGKRGLSLDLTKPEARDVVHDLVRWADVVLESFSPRAMKGFGYDYESLRQVKPDLVMGSSCIMGQTGPYASLAGFGTMAAAISGFFEITGWPDRSPSGAMVSP